MRVIRSSPVLRRYLTAARADGKRIGLVPTMGALHEGHLRLVDLVRRHCDLVVMSIYVNPTQFGPQEDFSKYPRPFAADRKLAAQRGVDVLFHPRTLYYPDASVSVTESELSRGRCGQSRPGHFDGVATVVTKLLCLIAPDVAIFGQKDGQQLDVIERVVRDLFLPVKILRAPIVRDANGLALSSRNRYLSPEEYQIAIRFAASLKEIASSTSKTTSAAAKLRSTLSRIPGLAVDYVESVNGRLFAAVKIGQTRLIDNCPLKAK